MSIEFVKKSVKEALKDYGSIFKDNNVMVAGGMFTSLFSRSEVNDVDCYFRSKEDLVKFIYDISETSCYSYFVNVTDKSMTLAANGYPTIQLIYFKYFDNLTEVFKSFDFTISMCGYDFKSGEIVSDKDFFSDLSQRRLSFNEKTDFPLISAIRVNKFRDRGFEISRSNMLKLLLTISKLNINTVEEFVSQVGGMYGNAALTLLNSDEEFSLEKALQQLNELERDNKYNPLVKEQINIAASKVSTMPLNLLGSILMSSDPLAGGWYRSGGENGVATASRPLTATFKDEDGCKCDIPMEIALLFAKKNERKEEPQQDQEGLFYKYVKKVEGSDFKFRSIYDPKFEYELGKEVKDANGMFVCDDKSILGHSYSRYADASIIACKVNTKDFVANVFCNNHKTLKLTPLFVVNKNGGNFTPSPSVTPKGQIEIEASKGISNDVKDMPNDNIDQFFL